MFEGAHLECRHGVGDAVPILMEEHINKRIFACSLSLVVCSESASDESVFGASAPWPNQPGQRPLKDTVGPHSCRLMTRHCIR